MKQVVRAVQVCLREPVRLHQAGFMPCILIYIGFTLAVLGKGVAIQSWIRRNCLRDARLSEPAHISYIGQTLVKLGDQSALREFAFTFCFSLVFQVVALGNDLSLAQAVGRMCSKFHISAKSDSPRLLCNLMQSYPRPSTRFAHLFIALYRVRLLPLLKYYSSKTAF